MRNKLTTTQQFVIDRMNSGYELGYDVFCDRCWLQFGKCGHGGESIPVSKTTLNSLLKREFVTVSSARFPLTTYCLTSKTK